MARPADDGGGGPFDYYAVSSYSIRAAAEDTRTRLSSMDSVKSQVTGHAKTALDAVEGDLRGSLANAPTEANAHADDVTQKATFAAGAVEMFAGYVDDFNYDSGHPRSVAKLNAAYQAQEHANFGTPAVSYPDKATPEQKSEADTQWNSAFTHNKNAVTAQLTNEYHQLEAELDKRADHIAQLLSRGPNTADLQEMYGAGALPSYAALIFPQCDFSGVTLTELPYDLRDLPADEVAAWLLSHPEAPANVVDIALKDLSIATEVGRQLGEEAKLLQGSFDRAELAAWTAKYERFASSPIVNSGLFTALGAPGTLDLLCRISQTLNRTDLPPDDQQRHVLAILKAGLQSATTYYGFDSTQFAHDLVKAGTSDLTDTEGSLYEQGYTGAMSYLLYDGHYGDTFIGTVAADLDHYERIDQSGTLHLWQDRNDSFRNGAFHWDDLMPGWAGGTAAQDPMMAVMSALSNSPHADLAFFSGGGDADSNGIVDRQEYYIKDRIWDGDGFYSISKALDTATTDPSLLQGPEGHNAAVLASATVNLFSERTYLDADIEKMGWSGDGSDDSGKHFAHVLATYMDGVDQARIRNASTPGIPGASDALWSDDFHRSLANVPVFGLDAVQKFSHVAMSTEDGLVELRNGLNIYEGQKLGAAADYLHAHPGDAAAQAALSYSVYHNADLEGMFMNELGDSKIAEAKGRDDAIKGWVDMGKDVVAAIPIPGAKALSEGGQAVLNLALSTGEDSGADALKDHLAHFEADETAKQNTDATSMLKQQEYAVAKTLIEHGIVQDPQALVDGSLQAVTKDTSGNYHVMSYNDFVKLPDAEQQSILAELLSTSHGVGLTFDPGEYESRYKDEFHEYFGEG